VLSNEQIRKFVQTWFDQLSEHVSVECLVPMVSANDLEMVFPERTIHSHAEFRDWYKGVGTAFANQQHILERLDTVLINDGAELNLTVVWKATRVEDGADIAARATQTWVLETSPEFDTPVIVRYHVRSLEPL
jgi:hypothetical protein